MALDSNLYATGAVTSGTVAPASTSGESYYSTFRTFDTSTVNVFEVESLATGSPFLTLMTKIGRSKDGSGTFKDLGISEELTSEYPQFKFLEIDQETDAWSCNAVTAAGTAGADSTFTVTSTAGLKVSHVIRNVRTNEQIRVTAVTSATQFTATRKMGDATNVATQVGDTFVLIATAVAHGVNKVSDTGAPGTLRENNIQKFMETITITDRDMLSNKFGGKEAFIKQRLHTGMYNLRMQMERGALFGEKSAYNDIYTSEGLVGFARRGLVGDISSGLTTRTLEDTLGLTTEYMSPGNNTKVLLLSGKAKSAINSLYTGRIQRESIADIKEQVETIEIGTGKFMIMQHPLLDQQSGYNGYGLVVDPGYFKIMYPTGKDLEMNGIDGRATFTIDPTSDRFSMSGTYSAYAGFKNVHANSAALLKIA